MKKPAVQPAKKLALQTLTVADLSRVVGGVSQPQGPVGPTGAAR